MNRRLLPAILTARAHAETDSRAYVFLDHRGDECGALTYGELHSRAVAVARELLDVCSPGDRAVLLFPPGLDFIIAYFGCLYAQVIAVPVNPPRGGHLLAATRAIVADCEPSVVLSDSATTGTARPALDSLSLRLQWIAVDVIPGATADLVMADPDPDSIAFLQYTSGSTSNPKGVRVTHGNLIANQRMIADAFGHDRNSTFVGWAPLFHDQGLIGNVLQPLYLGATSILMSPLTFIRRPLVWPVTISKYRAHTSGGPNFAFDACVAAAARSGVPDLDLTSWKVAFNGAEPIRADTLDAFARTFAPFGFDERALYPCYGLAEATLLVSGSGKGRGPRALSVDADQLAHGRVVDVADGKVLVGSGTVLPDEVVRIVDPASGTALPDGSIGEIRVSGEHISPGYWKGADTGSSLRTGDLGALVDGELFVVGRIKDMIIIRGRNYYPHDIEHTVSSVRSGPKPVSCAAFSINRDGDERLVVITEADEDIDGTVAAAIREAVTREHQLTIGHLVFTTDRLQKTSSGKIMRNAAKTSFLGARVETADPLRTQLMG